MASKAQRRRQRKISRKVVNGIIAAVATEADEAPRSKDRPVRPTAQRLAQGRWNMPTGPGKREQPMTDEASDMIGRLLIEGKLSISQEQAARRFQEAHTAYQASIGLSGYKSCLAGGSGAYDSSDGDPAAEAAYRNIRNRIGAIRSARLQVEVAKLAHERPMDLGYLKGCLDMLGGG